MAIAVVLAVCFIAVPLNGTEKITEDDLMDKGSWFEYKVTEYTSNVEGEKVWTEKYEIMSISGQDVVFIRYVDGVKKDLVNGNISYANLLVKNDDLSKTGTETIETAMGEKTVDVFDSNRCGGSTTVYQDESGLMYKSVESQLWSMGVKHSITRELISLG